MTEETPEATPQPEAGPESDKSERSFDDSHSWAKRHEQGYFQPFFSQVWEMIKTPTEAYRRLDPTSSFLPAVYYGLLITILAALPAFLWQHVLFGPTQQATSPLSYLWSIIWFFLTIFLVALINIFLASALSHGILKLLTETEKPYGASVKAYAYSQTATVANVVPYLGNIIGTIWSIVLAVIGLREQHEVSTGESLVAVLVPLIFFIIVFTVFFFLLFVALGPDAESLLQTTTQQG